MLAPNLNGLDANFDPAEIVVLISVAVEAGVASSELADNSSNITGFLTSSSLAISTFTTELFGVKASFA